MEIIVDNNYEGMNVRTVLTERLGYSSSMIKRLKFSEGGITVNGSFVTVRYVLRRGDVLALRVEDTEADVSPYTIPCDLPIDVLYEDEAVTVVNKPPNMPAHPSLGHKTDTVANALAYRYREKPYAFRPVNRLDRDTSGCMLTANSRAASYRMYLAMTEGRVHKRYLAALDGVPEKTEGVLESFLRREEGSIIRREETSAEDPAGKRAVTEYRVLYADDAGCIVEATPVTGRTHQLRVQFAGIGLPIMGDTLYGKESPHIARHALHCFRTVFPHPADDREIEVCAPLPEDMRDLLLARFGAEAIDAVRESLEFLA